jgi:SNF family Na+-dependent transporter
MKDSDLGFVLLPFIFSQMQGSRLYLFLYFVTLIFLGIDSMMGFI